MRSRIAIGLAILGAALALAGSAQAHRHRTHPATDYCRLLARTAAAPTAQTITVVNQANVKPEDLCHVELAIQRQALQLRAAWGTPPITFGAGGWPLVIEASLASDCQNWAADLGCHGVVNGSPTGWVETGGIASPSFWSAGFSHEVLEMLADPFVNRYADSQLVEVCDPPATTYQLKGASVSDFALPAWFTARRRGRLDWLWVLLRNGSTHVKS